MRLPSLPSNIGKSGTLRLPPDGKILRFKIVDEIRRVQSDLPEKFICLQRIEFDDGREQFRLGYYIIGKLPKMKGRWVWGQFATLVPQQDFVAILREAEKRGWF
jgi:hypothetical protein